MHAGTGEALSKKHMRRILERLTLALLLAATTAQTIVELEYECGDLPSCRYINDGECDDGGPSAK